VHLSQVDLNLFVVLEAIYREGNITRAGQQLNLTQPAISHALKRLRDLLQDPLFVRQGPHMVPTPFTRNMIEEVRQALHILEVNLSASRNFVPQHTRRNFHLSLWEYAEALIFPLLLRRLTHAAPGMSITTSQVKRRLLGKMPRTVDVEQPSGIFRRQVAVNNDKSLDSSKNEHGTRVPGIQIVIFVIFALLVCVPWLPKTTTVCHHAIQVRIETGK